jgi:hypothetical protein
MPPPPVHAVVPSLHAQVPAVQVACAGQRLLHAPQSCTLVCTLTQTLAEPPPPPPPGRVRVQLSSPAAQPVSHAPATQRWPKGHAAPQAPQLKALFCRSTHAPLHGTEPAAQVHAPPAQLAVAPHW